ncbi:ABA-related RING-type E3 ligase, Arabidopsis Toxicos en Levadura 27 [Hibiscus trionum]|uniref:ABA-related RING-type E3 ligase, Arabidopsis Toxicos en Levadura 27 n=1 Tax=Hibiscus trionum TaxID=183268 RepID=A0A9W7JHQ7_HIBTR|nr:ABA-related RING-type E3 ligase, Arabidopsis Toxicos en Levadura 27 [Hibiscus trionum]
MALTVRPSSPFTMSCFSAEEARELCCSATSLVISKLFCGIFIFIFAVVGATLGALVGAFVGAKTKIGCLHGATVGAIRGSFLSIDFFKLSLVVCSSDYMATSYFLRPINACNEGLSKDAIENIPSIRVTEEDVVCCSICLEDLVRGEIVHSLPHCHHKFHTSCIQTWLNGHKSCPLCRRNILRTHS